jgi:hypothetical protein
LKNKNKNLRYHFIIPHKQFQKNVLLEYKIGFEGGEMGGKTSGMFVVCCEKRKCKTFEMINNFSFFD